MEGHASASYTYLVSGNVVPFACFGVVLLSAHMFIMSVAFHGP